MALGRQFTAEQTMAIETRGCDLLVSAAAGSGKTAVLIERLIRMITDAKQPVELDRLLVVTFTEAAASEMRQRLGEALRERLRENPEDEHLQRQMLILPKASITTIHSFCLQVVRANFARLGIDPSFRVADVTETALLKLEIMRGLFERLYEEDELFETGGFGANGRAAFLRLVEFYGNTVKDDALQGLALELYEFSRSKPWPAEWLLAQAESFRAEDASDWEDTEWYASFREEAEAELLSIEMMLDEGLSLSRNVNLHTGYAETLDEELTAVRLCLRGLASGLAAYVRVMNGVLFGRLPTAQSKTKDGSLTEDGIKALKADIQDLRNDAKKRFAALREKTAYKPASDMVRDMNDLYDVMRALTGVVSAFSEAFTQEKRRRNIADFSDFEHLCLEVLLAEGSTEENPIPTDAALVLQEKYEEVLIDEYQDSNWVQELILLSVSRKAQGAPNRFMVGDMKQSIYRFRMANPDLFRRKFVSFAKEAGGTERLIGLSKNFRSRDGVLDGINLIFKQTMDEALGDVVYDETAMLYCGAEYPPYAREEDRACELLLVETKMAEESDSEEETEEDAELLMTLSKAEAEARMTALRIRELVGGVTPYMVSTKEGHRAAEYRDVVVLLRSPGVVGEVYAEEMRRIGIPAFAGSAKGYFEAGEVLTVLAFLQVIDNPRQDLHLITVLHSPVYGFTADELVDIRACGGGLYYDAVEAAMESELVDAEVRSRLAAFWAQLAGWRDRAVLTPISTLLRELYEETGYFREVGTMAGGAVRRANLTALFERAVQYEKTSLKGLFHFIRYIERLQKSGQDMGDAKVLGENDNVVRIMSVHKSKGLEFPIVFVCGLGRALNMMDTRAACVMHAELGFGPKHIDLEKRVVSNTLKRFAVAARVRRENLSEELRLLYVALTRAREKLILTGAVDTMQAEWKKHRRAAYMGDLLLPLTVRRRAVRFLDWVLPALLRHRDAAKLSAYMGEEWGEACPSVWSDASRWRFAVHAKAAAETAEQAEVVDAAVRIAALRELDAGQDYSTRRAEVEARLSYRYDTCGADEIPSKLSVSEIKRMHYAAGLKDSALFVEAEGGYLERAGFAEAAEGGQATQSGLVVPRFVSGDVSPSAMRRGTLLHTVLEHIDFHEDTSREAVDARIADLVRRGFVPEGEAEYIDRPAILSFMHSDIAARIRQSADVRREVKFVVAERPHDANPVWDEAIEAPIVVHGVIDLMFREKDGFVLVDYKTDRFVLERVNEVAERYRPQIALYGRAIQRMTGFSVNESILYFFSRKMAVGMI